MFTLQQIKAAHAKVKTGADFPQYVQEIKELGLLYYEFFVTDGAIIYHGENGYQVDAPPIYAPQEIAPQASVDALEHTIAIHQQGQTDFLTFCKQAAQAGVARWIVDTVEMMCSYVTSDGGILVEEPIPAVE
ncbi:DUF1398 domain-containing protein [Chitinophaga sp. S165]|uniref:DUF1398 domain-containing protein n=1 Tax=Chitinophaga sp. S165 TaxID=2135462 RepID=UPI000D710DF2|nr:DUF1398 family protein [Chitinophaga sp. S165]PWV48898.1 uncharacterized protein YbcV (DUF1398 family) [Chitinophaga sp. S165]